jgi:hypothetical protein
MIDPGQRQNVARRDGRPNDFCGGLGTHHQFGSSKTFSGKEGTNELWGRPLSKLTLPTKFYRSEICAENCWGDAM